MLLDLATGRTEPSEGCEPDLIIPPDADLSALADAIRAAPRTIRLEAAGFKDGRVYSRARLLRERYLFAHVVEVAGPVLPDQAAFLRQSGVTRVLLETTDRLADFIETLDGSPHLYQRGFPVAQPLRASGDTR
jgi:uncharacterized protein (DUF934 family)